MQTLKRSIIYYRHESANKVEVKRAKLVMSAIGALQDLPFIQMACSKTIRQ
jgi:hypothetical protein